MEEAGLFFNKGLHKSIEDIVVCGGPLFGYIQWRLDSLPICFGGLSLYSGYEVSSYVFVASMAQSWNLQDHILHDNDICGIDFDYLCVLNLLRYTILGFDCSGFTNKDIPPSLNPKKHWCVPFFAKSSNIWKSTWT